MQLRHVASRHIADVRTPQHRVLEGIDPIEHAILVLGFYELKSRIDVPYRVALNEAVELARKFGATDGHKFVNAVLDRAAGELRAVEKG